MTTRSLKTILMSAYLTAMLASTVAPIRSDATLAATIDPTAAQRALQVAVDGMNVSGWTAASNTAAVSSPAGAISTNPPAATDPVMNEELMARLIKYTRGLEPKGSVSAPICKELKICDGTAIMPLKLIESDAPNGRHYFGIPPSADSKDVLIFVKYDWGIEAFLTDKTGKLKLAVVSRDGIASRISNEKAADAYKRESSLFAVEASDLPPAGTSVASNG
jgi:hypothetical protein